MMPTITPDRPRFSASVPAKPVMGKMPQAAPALQFGYAPAAPVKPMGRWLKSLDFQKLGETAMNQVMLIYASIIASRFVSAFQRMMKDPEHRSNEIRETAARDPLGFMVWIFGVPVLMRLFLKYFAPARIKDALVRKNAPAEMGQGPLSWLKRLNPLKSLSMPNNQDLIDTMRHELERLERSGIGRQTPAYQAMKKFFEKKLIFWGRMATGLGQLATIGLLGIGVVVFNITGTNRRNARHQGGMPQ